MASTGTNFNYDFNSYTLDRWTLDLSYGGRIQLLHHATRTHGEGNCEPDIGSGNYTGQIVVTVEGNGSTAMTIPVILTVAGPVATLDVDASISSTKYDALTDGLLVLRYLFGLTGTSLTTGALGGTATRTDPAAIKTISMASALRLTLMAMARLTRDRWLAHHSLPVWPARRSLIAGAWSAGDPHHGRGHRSPPPDLDAVEEAGLSLRPDPAQVRTIRECRVER